MVVTNFNKADIILGTMEADMHNCSDIAVTGNVADSSRVADYAERAYNDGDISHDKMTAMKERAAELSNLTVRRCILKK